MEPPTTGFDAPSKTYCGSYDYLLVFKITNKKGLEDGSVGKVLALKAEGPEFDPQNPIKKKLGMGSEMVPV